MFCSHFFLFCSVLVRMCVSECRLSRDIGCDGKIYRYFPRWTFSLLCAHCQGPVCVCGHVRLLTHALLSRGMSVKSESTCFATWGVNPVKYVCVPSYGSLYCIKRGTRVQYYACAQANSRSTCTYILHTYILHSTCRLSAASSVFAVQLFVYGKSLCTHTWNVFNASNILSTFAAIRGMGDYYLAGNN